MNKGIECYVKQRIEDYLTSKSKNPKEKMKPIYDLHVDQIKRICAYCQTNPDFYVESYELGIKND